MNYKKIKGLFEEYYKHFKCCGRDKYAAGKAAAHATAVDYQCAWEYIDYVSDFYEICVYFEKLGRRYGLIREFKENGII